jgi:hypothetical protein
MQEAVLHYIWQKQLFNHKHLRTTAGEPLQIYKPGTYNPYSGPDFQHASISIENLKWFGHIEIHKKSSDWYHHKHHLDEAFHNTILHVVLTDDKPIYHPDGTLVPTLTLSDKLSHTPPNKAFFGMQALICRHQFSSEKAQSLLPSMAQERLIQKSDQILLRLQTLQYNWVQLAYEVFLTALFAPHNQLSAQLLSETLPAKALYQMPAIAWEPILLYAAGLLTPLENNNPALDPYHLQLLEQVKFYSGRVAQPLLPSIWQSGKIRPAHSPSLRLAIMAGILEAEGPLHDFLLSMKPSQAQSQLSHSTHNFWEYHYSLSEPSSKRHSHSLSANSIELLLMNGVIPLQLAYARFQSKAEDGVVKALQWLQLLHPEDNRIIRFMTAEGHSSPANALESQALLQLYKGHCVPVKCSGCALWPLK